MSAFYVLSFFTDDIYDSDLATLRKQFRIANGRDPKSDEELDTIFARHGLVHRTNGTLTTEGGEFDEGDDRRPITVRLADRKRGVSVRFYRPGEKAVTAIFPGDTKDPRAAGTILLPPIQ